MINIYEAVRERLREIDPKLVPHPQQIGMFEGYAAVGAALLAAVGSHSVCEVVYIGGSVESWCESCPGRPAFPCNELRQAFEALGISLDDQAT